MSVRELWAHYRAALEDPKERVPVLMLTVVWVVCWSVIAFILLTMGAL